MSGAPRKFYHSDKTLLLDHSRSDSVDNQSKARRIRYDSRKGVPSPQSSHSKNYSFSELSGLSFSRDSLNSQSIVGVSSGMRANSTDLQSLFLSPNSTQGTSAESRLEKESISSKQIEIYGQVFDDIIKQDTVYGGLLISVKKNYDDYIQQLLQQNIDLQEKLKPSKKTNTYEEILKEFSKLKIEIQQRENTIEALQREKQDIEHLRAKEKNYHDEVIKKLTNDFRSLRARENKYAKLFNALKEKGCPVEEVYNSCIRRKPKTDTNPFSSKLNILIEEKGNVDKEKLENNDY